MISITKVQHASNNYFHDENEEGYEEEESSLHVKQEPGESEEKSSSKENSEEENSEPIQNQFRTNSESKQYQDIMQKLECQVQLSLKDLDYLKKYSKMTDEEMVEGCAIQHEEHRNHRSEKNTKNPKKYVTIQQENEDEQEEPDSSEEEEGTNEEYGSTEKKLFSCISFWMNPMYENAHSQALKEEIAEASREYEFKLIKMALAVDRWYKSLNGAQQSQFYYSNLISNYLENLQMNSRKERNSEKDDADDDECHHDGIIRNAYVVSVNSSNSSNFPGHILLPSEFNNTISITTKGTPQLQAIATELIETLWGTKFVSNFLIGKERINSNANSEESSDDDEEEAEEEDSDSSDTDTNFASDYHPNVAEEESCDYGNNEDFETNNLNQTDYYNEVVDMERYHNFAAKLDENSR